MDLVSSIRKTGSRGGVNFNWEDVAGSNHRENYLGHSLKAPVGRWQKGRDLTWYAKSNATDSSSNETPEERAARERREELKKIKEAEEDALARALGLPVAARNVTGANAVDVDGSRGVVQDGSMPETEDPRPEASRSRPPKQPGDSERRHRRRHRSRSHSRSRNRFDRGEDRERDRDRDYGRDRRRDDSPRRRYDTHHYQLRDQADDRRGHRSRTAHSREREAHTSGRSHRNDRNRKRSKEGFDRRRADDRGHPSTSREQRSKSPRRY
ncbi:hypothetical protein GGR50DRAFT_302162 [Xylaria sp. CBS 124048]|nr:hypothetical protein GGR50DRAFT_302162 [Xylaria sp. CBS 124048]